MIDLQQARAVQGELIRRTRRRPHTITFVWPEEDLAAGVLLRRPAWPLLDHFQRPQGERLQRFIVTAGTAGTGTNTVVLESTTTNPFTGAPSWTVRATAQLGTGLYAEVTTWSGWLWHTKTEYLRVRCSAVGGTAPKDVEASFDWR